MFRCVKMCYDDKEQKASVRVFVKWEIQLSGSALVTAFSFNRKLYTFNPQGNAPSLMSRTLFTKKIKDSPIANMGKGCEQVIYKIETLNGQ